MNLLPNRRHLQFAQSRCCPALASMSRHCRCPVPQECPRVMRNRIGPRSTSLEKGLPPTAECVTGADQPRCIISPSHALPAKPARPKLPKPAPSKPPRLSSKHPMRTSKPPWHALPNSPKRARRSPATETAPSQPRLGRPTVPSKASREPFFSPPSRSELRHRPASPVFLNWRRRRGSNPQVHGQF